MPSKSPSSLKLEHTPQFSNEFIKYFDIDFSIKGKIWNNILSIIVLFVVGGIATLIFLLIDTNNDDDTNDINEVNDI